MSSEAEAATETDNFAAAFEKLAELGDQNPPEDLTALAAETPAADETPAVDEPPPADETSSAESTEESDESTEESDEQDEAPPAQAKLSDDELLDRFARIVKEKEPPAAETHQVPPDQQQQSYYNDEEVKFLQEFEKEWPDIARADALKRRAEYRDVVGYVFQEVAKEFMPIMDMVRTLSERTHLNDLHATVNDYDDVRDKVIDWVGKQPAYLQAAYNHVIKQGTVDEVADLIDRYRQASGASTRAAPATKRSETELPTATKQAAAALAPVSSKRSAVIAGQDPNDFESAFSSFAEKL
jgi:hypothetical protein